MNASANVVDVTDADFERTVIEASKERPVVVDLWASWCGPCRTLGPTLEKVAGERDGAFLLAKLDVDANPRTASAFGVQSIPTVIAFRDGEPLTGFVGALPEAEVNRFVDEILPSEAEIVAAEAKEEAATGDVESAEQGFREALEADPANRDAAIGLARLLLDRGDRDEARPLVAAHLPDPEAERLHAELEIGDWAADRTPGALGTAKREAAAGDYRSALEGMLAALGEDRDGAREAMVTVFTALGEDDALVGDYRRRLTAALF
jgi:putative thioredoxin